MTSITPTPPGSSPRRPVVPVIAGLCLLGGGYLMYSDLRGATEVLAQRVQQLDERASSMDRTLQLYRFEQQSKQGLGFPALLEQVRFWAPHAAIATTPQVQIPVIEERLQAVCSAIKALGPEAMTELEGAFAAAEAGKDYEVRRWLLRAMVEVDRERAIQFLASVLRGFDHHQSPRTRLFAADLLTSLDARAAAASLEQILLVETHRGLNTERLPAEVIEEHPKALENLVPYNGFSSFVQRYAATGHADEQVLLKILHRWRDYDLITLQETVKALGALGSAEAAEPIKGLFANPPRNFHPMFRNHCLDAIDAILGSEACDYFKEVMRREELQIVINKLTELIKKNCG